MVPYGRGGKFRALAALGEENDDGCCLPFLRDLIRADVTK